jgi:hypothetical protein
MYATMEFLLICVRNFFCLWQMLQTKSRPSIDDISRWKAVCYDSYQEGGHTSLNMVGSNGPEIPVNLSGSGGHVENEVIGDPNTSAGMVAAPCSSPNMPLDWHHPNLGIKCFIDKWVRVGPELCLHCN